jgi:adenosine deaminase
MSLESYLLAIPKVELHIHLEGSTQPETLLMLADRHGVKLPAQTIEGLRDLYKFRNFHDFIDIYMMILECLQTPLDISDAVYRFASEMARQNIRYAEVTWTPQFYVKGKQMPFPVLLEAINDGRTRAKREWGVWMQWIPDIVRNMPDYKQEVAEWVSSDLAREGGVVALGLGGFEVDYPPELFTEQARYALEHGLPVNPHAGETVGPSSIWGSIRSLQATRIGHGVRSVEDPTLVQYLAEHQIPLEVNVTSNLCLQVYPSYAQHPLKQLHEAGCLVTINSDDPPLFNTDLTSEYLHAIQDCGLTLEQVEQSILNAIGVTYLPASEKSAMQAEFAAEFKRLRMEHHV